MSDNYQWWISTGADSEFSKGGLVHGNGACLDGPLSQEEGVSLAPA